MSLMSACCPCCCTKPDAYTLTRRESESRLFTLDDAFDLESDQEDDTGDMPTCFPQTVARVCGFSAVR